METNYGIPFRLLGLKTVQYAIFDNVHIEHDNVDLETSLSFGLATDKQIVGISARSGSARKNGISKNPYGASGYNNSR